MERTEDRKQPITTLRGWLRDDVDLIARLRGALEEIADTDPVDAALDPDRARRIARSALSPESNPEGQ